MPYGTAPRRVSPGVWVTADGRTLSAAGSGWWEHAYKAGQTDGLGHWKTPAPEHRGDKEITDHGDYVKRELANTKPDYQRDLHTLGFQGASELHQARQNFQENVRKTIEARIPKAEPINRAPSATPEIALKREQAAKEQKAQQEALAEERYGSVIDPWATRAPKTVNPVVGQVIKSFSPTEIIKQTAHDVATGSPWLAADIFGVIPPLRGAAAIRAGVGAARAAEAGSRVAEGVAAARGAYRTATPIRTAISVAAKRKINPADLHIEEVEPGGGVWVVWHRDARTGMARSWKPLYVGDKEGSEEYVARHAGTPQIGGGADMAGEPSRRFLRYNQATAQLPQPRSRIAVQGLKAIDAAGRAVERLPGVVDEGGVRKVFLTFTNRGKVTKYLGRAQRDERPLQYADQALGLKHLQRLDSEQKAAHFWYRQLPANLRNAEGLKLIQQKQAETLEHLTSGKRLEELNEAEAAIKAQIAETSKAGQHPGALLKDLARINQLKTNIPSDIEGIKASIAHLHDLIQNAPPVDQKALSALDALYGDRESILRAAGRGQEESFAESPQQLSQWLGLEPTGEEGFIGHRLPPEARKSGYPVSGGVGRVQSPQGVGTHRQMILASYGRLRPTTDVAIEDWQAAQAFREAMVARRDLGNLGNTYSGGHIDTKHYALVNPKAKVIPAHLRRGELAQFSDNYEDIDKFRSHVEEIAKTFVARTPAEVEEMERQALDEGLDLSDLRVIPNRLIDRYYGQYRRLKPRGGAALKGYDALVDGMVTSVVFLRLGYIPKNFVQNILMAIPHQGALFLLNAVKAAQAWRDPQLREYIRAAISQSGASGSLVEQGATGIVRNKVVGFVTAVADEPLRFTAVMHELAAERVISPWKPLMDEADRTRALDVFQNKARRAQLSDIIHRSRDAMGDFTRMTPDQAAMARRVAIIPGWLVAGTRYPFHFAATHPIRSALLAYIAMGEPGAPDALQFNKSADEYFAKEVPGYLQGVPTPFGLERTGSLLPMTTPYELAQAVMGKGDREVFDYMNPLLYGGALTINREVTNPEGGTRKVGLGEAFRRNIQERLAPSARFVQDLIEPHSTLYPNEGPVGRFKREIGVLPVHPDMAEAHKRYWDAQPTLERKTHELIQESEALGLGTPPDEAIEDLNWLVKLDKQTQKVKGEHRWSERYAIVAKLVDERYNTNFSDYQPATEGEAEKRYDQVRTMLYPTLGKLASEIDKRQHGVEQVTPVG